MVYCYETPCEQTMLFRFVTFAIERAAMSWAALLNSVRESALEPVVLERLAGGEKRLDFCNCCSKSVATVLVFPARPTTQSSETKPNAANEHFDDGTARCSICVTVLMRVAGRNGDVLRQQSRGKLSQEGIQEIVA